MEQPNIDKEIGKKPIEGTGKFTTTKESLCQTDSWEMLSL